MSSNSSSSARPNFIHPEDFTQNVGTRDEWFCNLCTPPNSGLLVNYMTLKAAQAHEQHSCEHEIKHRKEAESRIWDWTPANDWTAPLEPLLTIEQMKLRRNEMDVGLAQDIVPFWIRGVEAAKRGKVLRLEEFLEKLQNTWTRDLVILHGEDPWRDNVAEGGWGPEGWRDAGEELNEKGIWEGKKNEQRGLKRNKRPSRARRGVGKKITMGKAYDFVENVAKQEAADEERKQRMHNFYEMPTDEKLRKIGEVIKELNK